MMRILFLMIAYPDTRKNSSMYTDLAAEFTSKGHKVFVTVANGPVKSTMNIENGVNVLRVRTLELFNTSSLMKGLANILLPLQILNGIKRSLSNIPFDAILLATPPVTYQSTIRVLKKKYQAKVYLILRDIFPQNARDLGIIRSFLAYSFFRRMEKRLYSACDFIGCMSPANIKYIKDHNPKVDTQKLHLLPNWKKVTSEKDPDPDLKKKYQLKRRFILLYGGNIGKPQEAEFILELASDVRNYKDVEFLIIGDGTEKKKMIAQSLKLNLDNVIFMDPLPRDQYQDLARVCDIGLVNNSRHFTIPNIPSRILSYWEARLPVLAAIDSSTDLGHILEESASGLWCLTGDLDSYRRNFEKLYSDTFLRQRMGANGYEYLVQKCSSERAYHTINDKLSATDK